MAKVTLEHPNLAQHQASIMAQMRQFWMEGHLCDVVVKSRDGTEHRGHTTVLSAATTVLKTLLGGPFREADCVQRGQPIEISASDASVAALLDYIYGGQPQVHVEDSIELLRLADAYNLPQLAEAIQTGLRTSMQNAPVATALKVLQESHGFHDLNDACAEKIASNFEACAQHPDFLQLSPTQLGRIVQRDDLNVSREDVVLQGILKWINDSKDRDASLGLLLLHVDFRSISYENLVRIDHFAASIGPKGGELQVEAGKALQGHRKRSSCEIADQMQPKRRCLRHWSPDLGASSTDARKVLSRPCWSICWHEGSIYGTTCDSDSSSVICWKPGESDSRVVAGHGARVAGVNNLGQRCSLFVTLAGEIFVGDLEHSRLLSYANGSSRLVTESAARVPGIRFVSPNGIVYWVNINTDCILHKLVGTTLQPLSDLLPFEVTAVFVTRDEVFYLSDKAKNRIWRISPGATEPAVVGEVTGGLDSQITKLFVTEEGKIYAADWRLRKVWAFRPGDTTCVEVLQCPEGFQPAALAVQDRSLYVSLVKPENEGWVGSTYEYFLPPELKLE